MRVLIQSLIIGMSGRLVGCEDMCRFIMSSGVSGLLDILNTSRYSDMLLGVETLRNIFSTIYTLVDHGKGATCWAFGCCESWVSS